MKVVVGKQQLSRELRHIHTVMTEYEAFLRASPTLPDWETRAIDLVRSHEVRLDRAKVTLRTMGLVSAMIRELLARVPRTELTFTPLARSEPAPAEGADAGDRSGKLEALVDQLHGLAQHAPLALQEKIRILLSSIQTLFVSLIEGDQELTDETMDQINLLTSSRESRNLIREIAVIAREIYDSLNAVSDDLPLDDLTESTEGISEAVRKLKSVISRLEDSANQNLDALEASASRAKDEQSNTDGVLGGLRDVQQRLGELKLSHPAAAQALAALQDKLGDGVGSPMMLLQSRTEANRESYVSMMANQSFQDLTGQTLKKTIAFIENLQLQLMELLERYRPMFGLSTPTAASKALESSKDGPDRQSQDQVDSLLADLGF